VREPLSWVLRLGQRGSPGDVLAALARAARGPADDDWRPPPWLLPHQIDAARRLAGSLAAFGGAICADAVGLGKTYVALALATRHRRVTAVVPAILVEQWTRRAAEAGVALAFVSHEALSRGGEVPRAGLVIVDEAHRFRNPKTRRYYALARGVEAAQVLLLTATPVVNRAADLTALLRLFLADNGLAIAGLPSLEQAEARRAYGALALAATAVTVARTHAVAPVGSLPVTRDDRVVFPPPIATPGLKALLAAIGDLKFPTFAARTAARLLDLHLRYRFASSLAAGRETLRHHLRYLERAAAAARRGERLPRGAASLLHEELDGQLELDFLDPAGTRVDSSEIESERERVLAILASLSQLPEVGPKLEHLRAQLALRAGRKTIVFTAAVSTARAIARALDWREIAVVSGKGAWIASGRVPVAEALALFAPQARGRPAPAPAQRVATLVATDLASEGLDLQDADAVVHYDLPWTPLRLEQRVGRIARLGSQHKEVDVYWFAPPPELDLGLALRRRLNGKLATQFSLGVPVSSTVGKARISGLALEWKERLAARAGPPAGPRFAVVAGPSVAVFALTWHRNGTAVPDIVVLDQAGSVVHDPAQIGLLIEDLLTSPGAAEAFDVRPWLARLHEVVRERLVRLDQLPEDRETRRLARLIVRRAAQASEARDGRLLTALDQALAGLQAGVRAGACLALSGVTGSRFPLSGFEAWVRSCPPGTIGPAGVTLEGALFGDGSRAALSSRPPG